MQLLQPLESTLVNFCKQAGLRCRLIEKNLFDFADLKKDCRVQTGGRLQSPERYF